MAVYPEDTVDNYPDEWGRDDDGTMPSNVKELENLAVGNKIVSAETVEAPDSFWYFAASTALRITLDDGRQFDIVDTDDCCAYTQLESWILHPENVDNIITSVETENGFTKWHVLADGKDVLTLDVDWSCGNPFFYTYGFVYKVVEVDG